MSWSTLPPEDQTLIRETLTDAQFNVYVLRLAGCSQRRIATMLGISRSTARDRLAQADDALAALNRKDHAA